MNDNVTVEVFRWGGYPRQTRFCPNPDNNPDCTGHVGPQSKSRLCRSCMMKRRFKKVKEPVDHDSVQLADESNKPWVAAWKNVVKEGKKDG